jgi:thiol-disulfide isomerase/thioredoxin
MQTTSLLALFFFVAACSESPSAAPPRSRVDSVKADPSKSGTSADFCDVLAAPDKAARFTLPVLAPGPAPPAATGWRWINLWATWCKPCIEELPLLARWRDRLVRAGQPIELVFVSIDESDAALAQYKQQHADAPASVRVADASAMPAWMLSVGLDAGAPIPVHLLVDPAGRTRCVRAGGLREADYPLVERLIAGDPRK